MGVIRREARIVRFVKRSDYMRLYVLFLAVTFRVMGAAEALQNTSHEQVNPVTGRVIAHTMSVEGADWLDRPEREQEEQPERAISALQLKPGMDVGEIGAGTGFYALRIAKRIQPGGVYYANDIQAGMLSRLANNAAAHRITNIIPVLGTQTDGKLPARKLDYVLMVDVYHELAEPQMMLRNIGAALKPQGMLVLLEFRKEDPNVPIRPEHEMTVQDVKAELTAAGYVLDHTVETLPWQHMFFFRRRT